MGIVQFLLGEAAAYMVAKSFAVHDNSLPAMGIPSMTLPSDKAAIVQTVNEPYSRGETLTRYVQPVQPDYASQFAVPTMSSSHITF